MVAEAAVVPSPDPIRLAIPKAYVLLTSGAERSAATALSIFQHLHVRLAPFKRIRRIELVAELPKTISGKIRRVQLRRLEHDDNRTDALRRASGRSRGLSRRIGREPHGRTAQISLGEWPSAVECAPETSEDGMNSTIERDAYLDLVGKEVGVSGWHLLDQKRIHVCELGILGGIGAHADTLRGHRREAVYAALL
eukprot:gene68172-93389_t